MDKCFLPDMAQSGGVEFMDVIVTVIITIGSHQVAIPHVKPKTVRMKRMLVSTIHKRGTMRTGPCEQLDRNVSQPIWKHDGREFDGAW
jgi:hypothetical protein